MPSARAPSQLTSRSSTKRHSLAAQAVAQPLQRELVDAPLRLAHAHEGRVHHQLEDLVELGQLGAPERLPLAHVVGQQRGAQAAAAQLGQVADHRRVRLDPLEVEVAQARQVEPGVELLLEPARELGLGDLAALEHVQRVLAVGLGGALHRAAELLERHAGLLLVGEEAGRERGGEHPAEVADDGADHAAAGGSTRTISS